MSGCVWMSFERYGRRLEFTSTPRRRSEHHRAAGDRAAGCCDRDADLGNPTLLRRANAVLTIAWLLMVPVSLVTGLAYSVAFVSLASIYANAVSHLAAWRADVPIDG